jgi:hypothetical protein
MVRISPSIIVVDRCVAISATVRKLATIIFNMISKSEPYDETKNKVIKEKVKLNRLKKALKLVKNNGFNIIANHGDVMS